MARNKRTAEENFNAMMERRYMFGPRMNFAATEAYKLLRTNLMFTLPSAGGCCVIGVTSSFRGEGKSLTSLNLAYVLAEAQKDVILIEADMRLPTLASRLEFRSSPGLSNLLAGLSSVGESIHQQRVAMSEDRVLTMDILPAGSIPPNPSELIGSDRMQVLLGKLREGYDYIILDLPPVSAVTDALVASRLVDGMVVVVRSDYAVRPALQETIRQLKLVNTHILGFVFNGAPEYGSGYYKSHGYYSRKYYKKDYYYQK